MVKNNYDIAIIGAGPGGYVAAIRAGQLGLDVCVIEREHLGGICLNWGCIPTKALLKSSEINHLLHNLSEYGFDVEANSLPKIKFNLDKIIKRSRSIASQLSGGIGHLMRKNKIDVIDGSAKIISPGKLEVSAKSAAVRSITAKHIIIATGASARVLPGFEPDGNVIMTYKEAMTPKKFPKKLLVVGSGAIGVEFASFYNNLGSDVTVIEIMDRILPVEDQEVSEFMKKSLESKGIKIHTKSKLHSIKKSKTSAEADLEINGKKLKDKFDSIIMAVGIVGNTTDIGLENTKIKLDRGHIVTNEWCETAEKAIYAIGDVTGAPWLAHKASHEGVMCIEKIAGCKDAKPIKKNLIPGCTYSMPQVASVGLTESQARNKKIKIKVGKFPFIANGKAIAASETEGFIKTIFDEKTGELLGAHMVGHEVTEMIQGYAIAMTLEATEKELMHTIFPHPTMSESMHESVLSAFGRPLHI